MDYEVLLVIDPTLENDKVGCHQLRFFLKEQQWERMDPLSHCWHKKFTNQDNAGSAQDSAEEELRLFCRKHKHPEQAVNLILHVGEKEPVLHKQFSGKKCGKKGGKTATEAERT
ncbi:MAG: hypothetical protein H7836_05230 [Magnetococcus sp. YQC-3]